LDKIKGAPIPQLVYNRKMKKIGRGWQYTTYDLGNGRVLKKFNTRLEAYIHMFKECFPFKEDPIWKFPRYYRGCRETAYDSIKKLQNPVLENWMMGNPKFLNELDYEQDKLAPLHDVLNTSNEVESKKIIDSFVEFTREMIKRSIIDKSFNISKNFALDNKGRIVLMDLGELYSSKAAIEKQISDRTWAKDYIANDISKALRDYFVEQMDAAFKA
jgi:hypothetical protein